jgi:hypothetical protein
VPRDCSGPGGRCLRATRSASASLLEPSRRSTPHLGSCASSDAREGPRAGDRFYFFAQAEGSVRGSLLRRRAFRAPLRRGAGPGSAVVGLRGRIGLPGSLPRAVEAIPGSPSLPVVGVLALALPIPAIRLPLPLHIGLLPPPVIVGHVFRVLLPPAPLARLALRIAAVLPRPVAPEVGRRLLLPALGAALHRL